MSGSISLPANPFSDAEKSDIRRFAGYPPYGAGNSGFQSWRFFAQFGLLEYRLNNMAPAEIQNIRLKLGELYTLDAAIAQAGATLNVDTAAVFVRNRHEVRDRERLFNARRRQLASLLGVPPGPDLGDAGLSFVV